MGTWRQAEAAAAAATAEAASASNTGVPSTDLGSSSLSMDRTNSSSTTWAASDTVLTTFAATEAWCGAANCSKLGGLCQKCCCLTLLDGLHHRLASPIRAGNHSAEPLTAAHRWTPM